MLILGELQIAIGEWFLCIDIRKTKKVNYIGASPRALSPLAVPIN